VSELGAWQEVTLIFTAPIPKSPINKRGFFFGGGQMESFKMHFIHPHLVKEKKIKQDSKQAGWDFRTRGLSRHV